MFRLFLLCMCLPFIKATIRLQGKSFHSHQDAQGKQLPRGYEYYAHLQLLPAEACHPNATQNYTLIAPLDGVPVALLVGTGNTCTVAELSTFVETHVIPPGLVDFLILDDDGTPDEEESENVLSLSTSLYHHWMEKYHGSSHKRKSSQYPFHVLTVSYESLFELNDLLSLQKKESKLAGGPRITIDSKSGASGLWIALAALVAACSCSFLMILQGWLEPEDLPEEPQRPQRRRLTKEQVREMLPVYRYDGETLHGPQEVSPDMDCCAICLDEYEAGDTVRVMACNHAFHAKCVGKWLSERSAVCPLCKEDYYIEEEEEEEGESVADGPPNTDIEESAWSRIYQMLTATAENEPNEPSRRGGWFRRWFRPEEPSDLTEPLLDSQQPAAEEEVAVQEGGVDENATDAVQEEEEDSRSTVSV